jgi:hypothetical protein
MAPGQRRRREYWRWREPNWWRRREYRWRCKAVRARSRRRWILLWCWHLWDCNVKLATGTRDCVGPFARYRCAVVWLHPPYHQTTLRENFRRLATEHNLKYARLVLLPNHVLPICQLESRDVAPGVVMQGIRGETKEALLPLSMAGRALLQPSRQQLLAEHRRMLGRLRCHSGRETDASHHATFFGPSFYPRYSTRIRLHSSTK